jgi:hypothetical protein
MISNNIARLEPENHTRDTRATSFIMQANNKSPVVKNIRILAAGALMGIASVTGAGCNNNSSVSRSADGGANIVPSSEIGTAWYSGGADRLYLDAGNKQFFELGRHDVLTADKISKDYVSKITGSVDLVKYSSEAKNPAFYAEINNTCDVLLSIYAYNKHVYLNDAVSFINANMPLLKTLKDKKPLNHEDFLKALSSFDNEQIYGPDGVLNLLLAFNRVLSKLEPGTLKIMSEDYVQNQTLRIDLQKRNTRSVTVEPLVPKIDEPYIPDYISDIQGLETPPEKRVKPDGTFEVTYWKKDSSGNREIVVFLNINPNTKEVQSTWYYGSPGPIVKQMPFAQFESLAKSPAGLWMLGS